MEYQKIINLLDDTTNQPSECKTRNWVEMNDESQEHIMMKIVIIIMIILITLNLKCQ